MNVRYIGPWADYSGYGEANRNIVLALDTVGVELTTERLEQTTQQARYGKGYDICLQNENRNLDHKIRIIHLTPDLYIKYLTPNKYHIGHLFWETDKIPKEWVWNCNKMDEIWTGCQYQKQALVRSGVKVPINVFPQPVRSDIDPEIPPFKIKSFNGFLFYSIFEWIERKNPTALLKAYFAEFSKEDNVALLIKTYRRGFGEDQKRVIRQMITGLKPKNGAKVFLYEKLMSETEIYRLHATGDCFVSAHRGEGWGRPQTEAMVMGKPIISTNCGGVHEWISDDVAYLCNWEKKPVVLDEVSNTYEQDQNWAEIDAQDLRKKMRYVFENRDKAAQLGEKARKFVKASLNMEMVGSMMKGRLEEIEKSL